MACSAISPMLTAVFTDKLCAVVTRLVMWWPHRLI